MYAPVFVHTRLKTQKPLKPPEPPVFMRETGRRPKNRARPAGATDGGRPELCVLKRRFFTNR
jgi:hypothetical protein